MQSASFNGVNWLDTNLADVNDTSSNYQNIPWSTGRLQDGDFQVQTRKVVVGALSLFNDPEGGLLKADGQDMASVGGMRNWGATTYNPATDSYDMGWQSNNSRAGSAGMIQYTFSGPLTFANASDQISFDVVVDKDNPANVPGPWNAGSSPKTVTINKALVESVLPSSGGVIKDATDFATVLNSALNTAGTGAMAAADWDYATNNFSKTKYYVQTREDRSSGLTGSYVEISNFTSNVGSGGMFSASDFGSRGSQMTMTFASFTDFKDAQAPGGVSVNFDFGVDGAQKHYSFDRAYVNATLGKTDGSVATADEMVTLLQSLLSTDWPHVIISKDSASQISLTSDSNFDRLAGSDSGIGFSNIVVSNEPRATLDLDSIDIAANPSKLDSYIDYIDLVSKNVTDAAATVGAMQKSVSLQSDFVLRLKDTIDQGIGRLVDADMTVASTRQKALETRQQLAIQSLQIANAQPSSLLTLFRP